MAQAVNTSVLEKHPQAKQIIDLILDQVPSTKIKSKLDLRVNTKTVDRFRKLIIERAFKTPAKTLNTIAKPSISNAHSDALSRTVEVVQSGATVGGLRSRIDSLLDKRLGRRDRWIADAETSQVVNPVTGEVHHDMNHGALSRHDANELRDIETMAKLGGLLNDSPQTNVQLVIISPRDRQED